MQPPKSKTAAGGAAQRPQNDGRSTASHTEKWRAITENDARYDGQFYYAVKTTGIFCRPSCPSRVPNAANVEYFDTPAAALGAGYRPCKRCRPDLPEYNPEQTLARQVKQAIDDYYSQRARLAQALAAIGLSQHRMAEIFKARYGATPGEYADRLRIQAAMDQLRHTEAPILDIALSLGFESTAAFYAFFRKHTQMAPGEYRRAIAAPAPQQPAAWHPYGTPFGTLVIAATDTAITAVRFEGMPPPPGPRAENALTRLAAEQILEYAAGQRQGFDLPLAPAGTAFQQAVWRALQTIPYGQTRSYKQIAAQVGNPGASRAVGMANNKNPLPILVPCHRVVGANGALVGYAGGLALKQQLLALEMGCAGEAGSANSGASGNKGSAENGGRGRPGQPSAARPAGPSHMEGKALPPWR